jgi:pyruvate formate lyase activating enzyme
LDTRVQGRIFEIQRFSVHDGPGIRTTVFLKGCPLRCPWCHNPESQDPDPEIAYLPDKCIGCGYCLRTCPTGAHGLVDDEDGARRHSFDRSRCIRCGLCAAECWAGALEVVGRTITVEEALEEILADQSFYYESGGGVTLSGGEPLSQPEFTEALLWEAKKAGIHTAVETCLFASEATVERMRQLTDLFLVDLKETDEKRHQRYTGVPLEPILRNLRALAASGAAIRLRLPLIPGFNDRDGHFGRVAVMVNELNDHRPGQLDPIAVEVMPYHAMGTDKHRRFGRSTPDGLPVASVDAALTESRRERLRDLGLLVL